MIDIEDIEKRIERSHGKIEALENSEVVKIYLRELETLEELEAIKDDYYFANSPRVLVLKKR